MTRREAGPRGRPEGGGAPAGAGGGIRLQGVEKVYAGGVRAVHALNLEVEVGELMVLLGPSGCGKSTVLRMVAGLEPLTSGEIHIGGRRVDAEPPRARDVAMVFQGYALYGHMSVRRNLEFPLRMRRLAREERDRRVAEVAAMLELEEVLDAKPGDLSGGQQQRVAMGRALVREPAAFLMDEPLSNLDARLRGQVRTHIARIQARLGVTTLYVTHDQVEALTLGHRVAVMRSGRLQQVASGQELYDAPANTFVAAFIGQPGMNLVAGRVASAPPGLRVELGPASVEVPRLAAAGRGRGVRPGVGEEVVVGVRPERLEVVGPDAEGAWPARVSAVESLGAERVLLLESELRTVDATGAGEAAGVGPTLAVRTGVRGDAPDPGERVGLLPEPGAVHLFEAGGRALA